MKQQQARETGKILSAIYNTLDNEESAKFLQNIAKLDNILESSITYHMTNNFEPTIKGNLNRLEIIPLTGEIVYYQYENKYEKCVILNVVGMVNALYLCQIKILRTKEKHYVTTEKLYYNNPRENADND